MDKRTRWQGPLIRLRAILQDFPLQETLKWRQPVYAVDGGNIAILYDMKAFCGVSFFNGAVLEDPAGLLEPPGPNSRFARRARFCTDDEVIEAEPALRQLIAAAIEAERTGLKPDPAPEPEWPDALTDALADDPELAAAFDALTPGRQRGYAIVIAQAKQAATRAARVQKHRARILAGKGIHDR